MPYAGRDFKLQFQANDMMRVTPKIGRRYRANRALSPQLTRSLQAGNRIADLSVRVCRVSMRVTYSGT